MNTKVNLKTATLESMGIRAGENLLQKKSTLLGKGLLPYKVANELGVSITQPLSSTDIAKKVSQNSSGSYWVAMDSPKTIEKTGSRRFVQAKTVEKPVKRRSLLGWLKLARKILLPGLAPKKPFTRSFRGDGLVYVGGALGGMMLMGASVPLLPVIGASAFAYGLINGYSLIFSKPEVFQD